MYAYTTYMHSCKHTLAYNCHEIVLEIVELLIGFDGCSSSSSFLRPKLTIGSESVPSFVADCMKECWSEEPTLRPDFKIVRRLLKPMQKGM